MTETIEALKKYRADLFRFLNQWSQARNKLFKCLANLTYNETWWKSMVFDVSETLINAAIMFISVFLSFSLALWWDSKKDRKAREESLSQLKSSLKSELDKNLEALRSESYRVWEGNRVIDVRLLREATWKLIAGREDLKYLSPSSLAKISDAYVAIIDFNNTLAHWKSIVLLEKDRFVEGLPGRPIDLRPSVNDELQEEREKAIATIKKAIEICSLEVPGLSIKTCIILSLLNYFLILMLEPDIVFI